MSQTKFDIAVVIGRFQVPHLGHHKLIQEAARIADKVVIIIGSVGQPRTPKNPFTFKERKDMLEKTISNYINYEILSVRDQRYNLQHWLVDVAYKVNSTTKSWTDYPPSVAIVGHIKDDSSFYLKMFPQWTFHEIENHKEVNSTDIRDQLFEGSSPYDIDHIDSKVCNYLAGWQMTDTYHNLKEEYEFIKKYKSAYKDLPYPPIFSTVDAVVTQSGHILLVKRKAAPGKGLWALPGGFIGQSETIEDAMLRELVEETKIKLQKIILQRSITKQKVYDDPDRSLRGRTITHAFAIELSGDTLPRVKGSDDAEKAKWFPLNEVFSMGENIYEDHLSIILNITGDL